MKGHDVTYLQAVLIGLLQGVSELFPVSSLGHSIILPALIGGSWATNLDMSATGSPYLTFLVAVHVATAVALVIFFRKDWARIVAGLYTSIRDRTIATTDQRLAWLLIAATVPVGVAGIALEHAFRTHLGKPIPAAVFLILNGLVLLTVERLRRRGPAPVADRPAVRTPDAGGTVYRSATAVAATQDEDAITSDRRLARLGWWEGTAIGATQILALLPGISRSGVTMAAGLVRGLSHQDAARFAFLLATPVIAAAGVFKLPELAQPTGHAILGQVFAGSLVAGIGAYLSLRFLTRYFHTRTLVPFAIYCLIAGTLSITWLLASR